MLLLICGCDQFFGLRNTVQVDAPPPTDAPDAQYFDAGLDAPFTCPTDGSVPVFLPQLHQDVLQDCFTYKVTSTGRAASLCTNDDGTPAYVGVGPIDGTLSPALGVPIPAVGSGDFFTDVWITTAPAGDILIVAGYFSTTPRMFRYQEQGNGTWAQISDFGLAVNGAPTMSGMSEGANPHVIRYDTAANFQELVDDGSNTWTTIITPSYAPADLGVGVHTYPQLSADGLRLTFVGSPPGTTGPQRIYYTSRAAITGRFAPAVPLSGVPFIADALMDPLCSRVYVSGLASVWFAQRK